MAVSVGLYSLDSSVSMISNDGSSESHGVSRTHAASDGIPFESTMNSI